MSCKVTVALDNEKREFICDENSLLIDVLSSNNISISAPCGGKCLCGKCKVIVDGDTSCEPEEEKFLTKTEIASGTRLACVKRITKDTTVKIKIADKAKIAINGIVRDTNQNPIVKKKYVTLAAPYLHNSNHDSNRLTDAVGPYNIDVHALKDLGRLSSSANGEADLTAVIIGNEIVAVENQDTTNQNFSIAIDIGTTTVVAYLVDLYSGTATGAVSALNRQSVFGSDVISRINHTIENNADAQMQKTISDQINRLCDELIEKFNIEKKHVYSLMITGNTIMLHFLCGFPTHSIAKMPFNAVTTKAMTVHPEDIGLTTGYKVFLPSCMASYVGADITTAAIACAIDNQDDISLLVDIGTNGEILLGNKDKMLCCATAAGPAFEGAHIEKGVGGIEGAINKLSINKNAGITIETIADKPAIGICGSGILDAVAQMLKYDIIDETGRLLDKAEIAPPFNKLAEGEDINARFYISDTIYITANDIREIQLAKASVAAGINVLVKEYGIGFNDIKRVYLAGGFGSYMDSASAVAIGLLPKELENKIIICGNAAGSGAVSMLLDEDLFFGSGSLKSEYIDLSTNMDFQTEYVDCMMF